MSEVDGKSGSPGGGRLQRAWAEERRSWTERPGQWKLHVFMAALAALQVYLGLARGDRWFAVVAAIFALLCCAMSVLAYRAVHTR